MDRDDKIFIGCGSIVAIVILIIVGLMIFASCTGANWERTKKDWASNYGGGIERKVTAYSYTGEELNSWTGKFDISQQENEVKFDMQDGRRVIIRGGIVISEELTSEEDRK